MAFSFSFAGDDIESEEPRSSSDGHASQRPPETDSLSRASRSTAFPVAGQEQLPATSHSLSSLLSALPERISYSTLSIKLDDGSFIRIPRRELWDVRVQIMAEDSGDGTGEGEGLGNEDVKTGVYEGGFKSWECSVDLVRVLASRRQVGQGISNRLLEMGCGTALPSLALLQWALADDRSHGMELMLADYNPSVLKLVTVANLLLSWAYSKSSSVWEDEGQLDITSELVGHFIQDIGSRGIDIRLISGAWGEEFVNLTSDGPRVNLQDDLLVLAAETIYSPAALQSFAKTLMEIFQSCDGFALVGAKKVYFGVGGSMEDFCAHVLAKGSVVRRIREEEVGVRREVVEVECSRKLNSNPGPS